MDPARPPALHAARNIQATFQHVLFPPFARVEIYMGERRRGGGTESMRAKAERAAGERESEREKEGVRN